MVHPVPVQARPSQLPPCQDVPAVLAVAHVPDRSQARIRAIGERAIATLKTWNSPAACADARRWARLILPELLNGPPPNAGLLTAHRRPARDYERHPEVFEALIRWAAINGMLRRITRQRPARRQLPRTFTST